MSTEQSKPRFVFVDALRGIAALSVVLFHVYSKNLSPMTGYVLPEPLHTICNYGHLGVYIFFVISGFVIAQSIHGELITPRFAAWFAARRAIRLDIPYWTTIAAMVALSWVSNHMQHERSLPMPTIGSVVAHLFYLQGFFGYPNIVGVFWTLCYELQFYLALIVSTGLAQRILRSDLPTWLRSPWLLFIPLWLVALVSATGRTDLTDAMFLYGWPYFFLGVVVNWIHHKKIAPWTLIPFIVTLVAAGTLSKGNAHFELPEVLAASITALAIFTVSQAGRLITLSLGSVFQYLGRISYSLYLVHMLVGTPATRLGIRFLGKTPTFVQAIALMAISTGVSIVAAQILYVLVERPSTKLSKRMRSKAPVYDTAWLELDPPVRN